MSLARQLLGIFIHGDQVKGSPTQGGLVPTHGGTGGPVHGSPNLDPGGGGSLVFPAVIYDTSIGNGVDANGFADITPLAAGATRYYVKNSGNDGNAGTNPSAPLLTLAAAVAKVGQSKGDQVLLAEGSTFAEVIPYIGTATKDGADAQHPTVISSYDPADPTNTAKFGRGDVRNARPKITGVHTAALSNQGPNYFAIKGIDFSPASNTPQGITFTADTTAPHSANYILIENNIGRYTNFSIVQGSQNTGTWTGVHYVYRNNSFYSMWASGGNSQGIYASGTSNLTIEDNVFYHCGWSDTLTRDETGFADHNAYVTAGGATVFQHSFYLQTNTTGNIVRRNLSIKGGGDGGIIRGDGVAYENLFIDNPAAFGLGGGPNYNTERPQGALLQAYYNAAIGVEGVSSTHVLGWGINTANGLPGSRVHHNLLLQSPQMNADPNSGTASGFSNTASFNQPSYAQYDHNLLYNWVSQATQLHSFADPSVAAFPAQVFSSYDYNNWDGTALGTNTNNGATTFTTTYTKSLLYSALTAYFPSITDETSFINYVINHPEAQVQRWARLLLFNGYGVSVDPDTTAPTLTSPLASSPSAGNLNVGVTTNEGTGNIFWVLSTSNTVPHYAQIKLGLDATGAAVAASGSIAVSSTGAKTGSASGVAAGTYYVHYTHEDLSCNSATPVTSASVTIAATSTTWDPAHASTWVLSGGNSIATQGGSTFQMVFGSAFKTTGNATFAVTNVGSGGYSVVGLSEITETGFPGNNNGVGYRSDGVLFIASSVVSTSLPTYTTADSIDVDRAGNIVTIKKNGTTVWGPTDVSVYYGGSPVAWTPAASTGTNTSNTKITLSGW